MFKSQIVYKSFLIQVLRRKRINKLHRIWFWSFSVRSFEREYFPHFHFSDNLFLHLLMVQNNILCINQYPFYLILVLHSYHSSKLQIIDQFQSTIFIQIKLKNKLSVFVIVNSLFRWHSDSFYAPFPFQSNVIYMEYLEIPISVQWKQQKYHFRAFWTSLGFFLWNGAINDVKWGLVIFSVWS